MGHQAADGSAGRSGAGPRNEGSPPPPPLRSSASTPATALEAVSPNSPSPLSAAIRHRPRLGRSQDPRDRYVGPGNPPCSHPHPIPSGPGRESSPVLVPRPDPAPGFLACPSCPAGPWPSCVPVPSFSPSRLRWAGLCSPLPWPCAQPLLALLSHPPGAALVHPTCPRSLASLCAPCPLIWVCSVPFSCRVVAP